MPNAKDQDQGQMKSKAQMEMLIRNARLKRGSDLLIGQECH